jgi:hypothetical protein
VRQAIRTRHLSRNTEHAYISWIKRFIFFHNKRARYRHQREHNYCERSGRAVRYRSPWIHGVERSRAD